MEFDNMINSIIHGDCLEVMKQIPDKSIDMILCDLPYGTTQNKWDSIIPLDKLWQQYERIIKDNGAVLLTAQTPFDKVLGYSNLKLLKYEWIWDKDKGGGFLNAKKMPLKQHENILVFYKKLPTYNPQMTDAIPDRVRPHRRISKLNTTNYGRLILTADNDINKRYPTSIIKYSIMQGECNSTKRLHPTQKPATLFEYLIKTYTNEGDIVLDNCIGSGTTAIAAINTGRFFIGIEKEKEYYDTALERINKAKEGFI